MFRALVLRVTTPFQEILNESPDVLSVPMDCAIEVGYMNG